MYETLPKYCSICAAFSHVTTECSRLLQERSGKRVSMENNNSNRMKKTTAVGSDAHQEKHDDQNVYRSEPNQVNNSAASIQNVSASKNLGEEQTRRGEGEVGETPTTRPIQKHTEKVRHPWQLDREKFRNENLERMAQDSRAAEAAILIDQAYKEVIQGPKNKKEVTVTISEDERSNPEDSMQKPDSRKEDTNTGFKEKEAPTVELPTNVVPMHKTGVIEEGTAARLKEKEAPPIELTVEIDKDKTHKEGTTRTHQTGKETQASSTNTNLWPKFNWKAINWE